MQFATTHQFGKLQVGDGIVIVYRSDHFAATHHRYAMHNAQYLMQFVAYEDDPYAVGHHGAHRLKQPLRLLWCQY